MRVLSILAAGGLLAAGLFSPPRTGRVEAPSLPSGVVWMQGLAVAHVSATGEVARTTIVYAPGAIGPAMTSALAGWKFASALEDGAPVAAPVLIVAIVRPPSFPDVIPFGNTMEGMGRLPRDVPAPVHVETPPYPPLAVGGGVVVVEFSVGADGAIDSAVTLTPSSGFDAVALDAARQWTFRPAERNGERVPGCVYAMFGFVSPIVNTPRP